MKNPGRIIRQTHYCKECDKPAKLFYVYHFKFEGDPKEQIALIVRCRKHALELGSSYLVTQEVYEVALLMES